jgi:hypothetical protein
MYVHNKKINEKSSLNEMESSQKKDWVLTDKEEIILSFVTLLLQGIL